MINRDYLPYKSAREYMDRGMAKWMGFFISEHTTALGRAEKEIEDSIDEKKNILLLWQAYTKNKEVLIYTSFRKEILKGKIYDITGDKIYLDIGNRTLNFSCSEILEVMMEEADNERDREKYRTV